MRAHNLHPSPDRRNHDDRSVTVRLVRSPGGSATLTTIPNAHPWVLRKRVLERSDVD
jgi:hypothetical protein